MSEGNQNLPSDSSSFGRWNKPSCLFLPIVLGTRRKRKDPWSLVFWVLSHFPRSDRVQGRLCHQRGKWRLWRRCHITVWGQRGSPEFWENFPWIWSWWKSEDRVWVSSSSGVCLCGWPFFWSCEWLGKDLNPTLDSFKSDLIKQKMIIEQNQIKKMDKPSN